MRSDNKDFKHLKRIFEPPASIGSFIKDHYNQLIEDLNNVLKRLSLTRSFDSQFFASVSLPNSATTKIYHKMKVAPAYRLIVKQSGNSLITDGDFTENYVELINNGANDVIVSIILFKE